MASLSSSLTFEQINTASWVMGAVAISLSVGRYLIRWKVIGKFYYDDAAHLLAVLFMIGELCCYTASIPGTMDMIAWAEGEEEPNIREFDSVAALSAAMHILFYLTIWMVKLGFLLFYRKLFNISRKFAIAWWCVLSYNFIAFFVVLAGVFVQCGPNVQHLTMVQYCESEQSVIWETKALYFTYAAVVSSDLAVMILPLCMLPGMNLSRTKRTAIGALFMLSLVCIAFDTVRFVKSYLGHSELNVLWYNLEETVAVIVSAIPSYYSLSIWQNIKTYRLGTSAYRWSAPERTSQKTVNSHGTIGSGSRRTPGARNTWGSQGTSVSDLEYGVWKTSEVHLVTTEKEVV